MVNVRDIIRSVSDSERQAETIRFVAPVVEHGGVRVRIGGIVSELRPEPAGFSGWGVFRAMRNGSAELVESASLHGIASYCKILTGIRLRLSHVLQNSTWLAYPVNEGDVIAKLGAAYPTVVRLVFAAAFDVVLARIDGPTAWFERLDRRANPRTADTMREHLKLATDPKDLRFSGLTPEMLTCYRLATLNEADRFVSIRRERDSARLQGALGLAGGELRDYADRGEFWQVDWTTSNGERHYSAVTKSDLTVISSGICLSDRDRDFDLQSLVGVIERRGEDWY